MHSDRSSLNGSPNKKKLTFAERNQQADLALALRYDALNQAFIKAEKKLKALKPLHAEWVDYGHLPRGEYGEPGSWELLGIAKYKGEWRLCHAWDDEANDYGEVSHIKPIIEQPRDVRLRAVTVVSQLYERIVASKEDYLPNVNAAIDELTAFCNAD